MQFLIVACALLGVALGQYAGYPGYSGYAGYPGYAGYAGYRGYSGYAGYPGYAGYGGYPGYRGYSGVGGYPGYAGYAGYQGYQGYRGYPGYQSVFKPVEPKDKEAAKTVAEAKSVLPVVAPIVPIVPKALGSEAYARIVDQDQASAPDGSYNYRFQTENGIAAAESGSRVVGPNGQEEVVVGEYAYTAPDGTPIQLRYTADANGFHPQGVHIPSTGYEKRVAGK